MKAHSSARKMRKLTSEDEAGFTMIEMVIAIPIVFLVLGMVFSSVGVTIGLMGEVTKGAGASRVASATVDRIAAARNCAEVKTIVTTVTASNYDSNYQLSFPGFLTNTCVPNGSFPLTIDVKDKEKGKSYYSKALTMVVAI